MCIRVLPCGCGSEPSLEALGWRKCADVFFKETRHAWFCTCGCVPTNSHECDVATSMATNMRRTKEDGLRGREPAAVQTALGSYTVQARSLLFVLTLCVDLHRT